MQQRLTRIVPRLARGEVPRSGRDRRDVHVVRLITTRGRKEVLCAAGGIAFPWLDSDAAIMAVSRFCSRHSFASHVGVLMAVVKECVSGCAQSSTP